MMSPAREFLNTFALQEQSIRQGYLNFIKLCETSENFRLTPNSEASAYATTFAIYGHYLLKNKNYLDQKSDYLTELVLQNIESAFKNYSGKHPIQFDKPFMQLLTFSLSALYCLGTHQQTIHRLEKILTPLLSKDVEEDLKLINALSGVAQSGNKAMFIAILLIVARDYLGIDTDRNIEKWVSLHLEHANSNGFWGNAKTSLFLQFQNGYHQYEIFKYLNVRAESTYSKAALMTAQLADRQGHFAPYPGGGGCYDYDATAILTMDKSNDHSFPLCKLGSSIIREQNNDGGFCESHFVRPISPLKLADRLTSAPLSTLPSILKYNLNLMRPKHSIVSTHWTKYSRSWSESDLWDSWFRMMTLAKIQTHFDPQKATQWGFINFPGIGY